MKFLKDKTVLILLVLVLFALFISISFVLKNNKEEETTITPQIYEYSLISSSTNGIPFQVKCAKTSVEVKTDNGTLLYKGTKANTQTVLCNNVVVFIPTNINESEVTFTKESYTKTFKIVHDNQNNLYKVVTE